MVSRRYAGVQALLRDARVFADSSVDLSPRTTIDRRSATAASPCKACLLLRPAHEGFWHTIRRRVHVAQLIEQPTATTFAPASVARFLPVPSRHRGGPARSERSYPVARPVPIQRLGRGWQPLHRRKLDQ